MAASARLLRTAVFLLIFNRCLAWDNAELELFDLIEEVNANFYDILGVGQDASSSDIRKAYRKLTLQLHPDKNKAEDAEEKFRQLVAIYEVLKDEEKRQMYNRVLVEGLPDWRTPVFYYRRARKMGFVELSALLVLIVTIGQYLFGWAVYVERRLNLEDKIDSKKKKERKKKNKANEEAEELQEEMASLPQPTILGLWPFLLPGFIYWCICTLPVIIKEEIAERRRRKLEEEEEEEEEEEDGDGGVAKVRKPKRRKMEIPEYSASQHETLDKTSMTEQKSSPDRGQQSHFSVKEGKWNEDELVILAKAVNKFPGGTPKRWEKIANMVGRPIEEVCSMSKSVKGTYTMNLSSSMQGDVLNNTNSKMVKKNQQISDNIITTVDSNTASELNCFQADAEASMTRNRHKPTKIKKSAERTSIPQSSVTKMSSSSRKEEARDGAGNEEASRQHEGEDKEGNSWTQSQQMTFEWALRHFPKGTDKRWDKIAEQIQGKTKEDCIIRFKYLAEMVKKKKEDIQAT